MPDLRNPGVVARVIVLVHLMRFAAAALDVRGYADALTTLAMVAEPALLGSLLVAYGAMPLLVRLAWPVVVGLVSAVVVLIVMALSVLLDPSEVFVPPWRQGLLGFLAVIVVAEYLRLRARASRPANAEARLSALQARIRPHFLFNSLTAVLSLIHVDPHRAEQVLEDLADLFRVLMSDNASLVPMAREVELAREYLRIESLRLGDRLQVRLEVDPAAESALVPSLTLQPLAENAVHHGIEPFAEAGDVTICVRVAAGRVSIEVTNPWRGSSRGRTGNGMALDNIRERIDLHFDADASFRQGPVGDRYEVHIEVPLRHAVDGRR
jgi:two-component system sensor histidine kinase AlgZ